MKYENLYQKNIYLFEQECTPLTKQKNNRELELIIRECIVNTIRETIPIDKILIETDSPYLAPVPNRGKKNEPSFIDFTANKLSEIKGISKLELVDKTTDNFNRLFFQ